jgi:hypothetical protein
VFRIERLEVRASLDDPRPALDHARAKAAAGDGSWAQWVAEHTHGEALSVRLDVKIVAMGHAREVIETSTRGVFVETDVHPPRLEQQIAELAREDVPAITARLAERGHDVDLAQMYLHVELDPQLRSAVSSDGAVRRSHGAADHTSRLACPRAPMHDTRLPDTTGATIAL